MSCRSTHGQPQLLNSDAKIETCRGGPMLEGRKTARKPFSKTLQRLTPRAKSAAAYSRVQCSSNPLRHPCPSFTDEFQFLEARAGMVALFASKATRLQRATLRSLWARTRNRTGCSSAEEGGFTRRTCRTSTRASHSSKSRLTGSSTTQSRSMAASRASRLSWRAEKASSRSQA